MFSHSCEKIFVFFTIRKLKLLVAIYTVENGPFIKKSNLFFFFSKFTRIIAVLKWFPAVRWLFSRLLKLKSPLVSLVAFKLLEPGKQPTHSWKPFSHGKISKSVEKKKNKVLYLVIFYTSHSQRVRETPPKAAISRVMFGGNFASDE